MWEIDCVCFKGKLIRSGRHKWIRRSFALILMSSFIQQLLGCWEVFHSSPLTITLIDSVFFSVLFFLFLFFSQKCNVTNTIFPCLVSILLWKLSYYSYSLITRSYIDLFVLNNIKIFKLWTKLLVSLLRLFSDNTLLTKTLSCCMCVCIYVSMCVRGKMQACIPPI